jgi:hypothetical protein
LGKRAKKVEKKKKADATKSKNGKKKATKLKSRRYWGG